MTSLKHNMEYFHFQLDLPVDVAAPVGEGLGHTHRTVEPLEVGGALDGPRAEPVVGRGQGRGVLPG